METRMYSDGRGNRWKQVWDDDRGWIPTKPPRESTRGHSLNADSEQAQSVSATRVRRDGGRTWTENWDDYRGWVPSAPPHKRATTPRAAKHAMANSRPKENVTSPAKRRRREAGCSWVQIWDAYHGWIPATPPPISAHVKKASTQSTSARSRPAQSSGCGELTPASTDFGEIESSANADRMPVGRTLASISQKPNTAAGQAKLGSAAIHKTDSHAPPTRLIKDVLLSERERQDLARATIAERLVEQQRNVPSTTESVWETATRPIGTYAGRLDVEPETFVLRCKRLVFFLDHVSFAFTGHDPDYGAFVVDASAKRNAEGNYHVYGAEIRWTQYRGGGPSKVAAITFIGLSAGDGPLEVNGQWVENGIRWRFRGALFSEAASRTSAKKPSAQKSLEKPAARQPEVQKASSEQGVVRSTFADLTRQIDLVSYRAEKKRQRILDRERKRAQKKAAMRRKLRSKGKRIPAELQPAARSKMQMNAKPSYLPVKRCSECGVRIVWVGDRTRRAHDVTSTGRIGPTHACGDGLRRERFLQGGAIETNRRRH